MTISKQFTKGNLTVTKVAPANTISTNFQKTYSGNPGDTFTAEEDLSAYCQQFMIAGTVAYTKGKYPNDYSDYTHFYTSQQIFAPAGSGAGAFQSINNNGWWEIHLANDTLTDITTGKFSTTTGTPTNVYNSYLDATNGGSVYTTSAITPVSASLKIPDVSYSPACNIVRAYGRDKFYRVKVYKKRYFA
ncbi:MAG: hypothetical protein HC930_08745 [Hydrococcus sp. SU_1_0]|nr:hypothetical protein [Hydrococcus sp. SU_1_0]